MKEIKYIAKEIKNGNANITFFLTQKSKEDIVKTLIFCLNNYTTVTGYLLVESYSSIILLNRKDWRDVVNSINDVALYGLENFFTTFCYLDERILIDIGLTSFDLKKLKIDKILYPKFIDPLSLKQKRMKKLFLTHTSLTENELIKLYDLFSSNNLK